MSARGSLLSFPQDLRIIRGETAKLTEELVFLFKRMDSADLNLGNNRVLMSLLKHCCVSLSCGVENRWEWPPRPAMDSKMDTTSGDHGPIGSISSYWRSLAPYHTAHSGPLPCTKTPIPCYVFVSYRGGRHYAHHFHCIWFLSPVSRCKRDLLAVAWMQLNPVFRSRKGSLSRFLKLWIIVFIDLLIQSRWFCYMKLVYCH